jgi:hypothetical protein
MEDYHTEAHTGVLAINYLITRALNVNFSAVYTNSKAHMDNIELGGPTCECRIPAADPRFEATKNYDYDFSEVSDYSDLDIEEIDLVAGFAYDINKSLSVGAEYTYLYYRDNEPYLSDGTGGAHMGMFNLTYGF